MSNNIKYRLLIPVWGKSIQLAKETILKSLLLSNNLKFLATKAECELVIYTQHNDILFFQKEHKYFTDIGVSFQYRCIDDEIFPATSLTLSYCVIDFLRECYRKNAFGIILNSDFILSNGSLLEVYEKNISGINNLYTGNYQCSPEIITHLNFITDHNLDVNRDELIKSSLKFLGHTTLNQIINVDQLYYPYRQRFQNRFFWRTKNGLLGSYFLIHPFCIKPSEDIERAEINASFDFIMNNNLVSGASEIISYSSKFFIVEVQDQSHELNYKVARGRQKNYLKNTLYELAFWVTERQILNSKTILNFTTNINISEDSNKFSEIINSLSSKIHPNNLPHKYWLSLNFHLLSNIQKYGKFSDYHRYFRILEYLHIPKSTPLLDDMIQFGFYRRKYKHIIFLMQVYIYSKLFDSLLIVNNFSGLIYIESTDLLFMLKYSRFLSDDRSCSHYDSTLSAINNRDSQNKIFCFNYSTESYKSFILSNNIEIKFLPFTTDLFNLRFNKIYLIFRNFSFIFLLIILSFFKLTIFVPERYMNICYEV